MGRVSRTGGFTLLELMIVVAIIGILSTTAIAGFQGYQLRTKFAEGKTNLGSIRTVQNAYFAERSAYEDAAPSPALAGHPNTAPQNWKAVRSSFSSVPGDGFDTLGWAPEGAPYFDYQAWADVSADGPRFTLAAIGDTDGDGAVSAIMYIRPDTADNYLPCAACGGATVAWDPVDCSVVFDEVAQVLSSNNCGFAPADDF